MMIGKYFGIIGMLFFSAAHAQDTVIIDQSVQHQTIEGWGHGGGILGGVNGAFTMLDEAVADPVNYQYLDFLVDELGLTGSRVTEVGPRTDGTGMDNGDCDVIDWSLFQPQSLPSGEAAYLVYFKNKVLAKGYEPSFYSSTGYPTSATSAKPWVLNHPGERSQQIWANAVYMRYTYGININYAVIYNEPAGAITSTILSDDIKALGPRLIAQGLATKSQYAEAVAPLTDWNLITPVASDDLLWSYVGRLSYHNYGTADPYRAQIYDFAQSKGLTTAQTEMYSPTFDDLYSDLTLGGVSYWEVGYSANTSVAPNMGLTAFTPSGTYIRLHQVLHYVTPGSVRIDAVTNDPMLHVLSFEKNGKVTTIMDNTNMAAVTVSLSNLPPGNYGVSRAQPSATSFEELGVRIVDASGTLDLTLNGGGWVTTLYPYDGPNHAPDLMTFSSNPGYLVLPASTATLSATASDTELDPLTYQWTVVSAPPGGSVLITTPNAPTTTVSGLSTAGTYVFNISVSDGISVTTKKVYLLAYNTNPGPVLNSAGFRISAPYGLVFGTPGEATHANIELPVSSASLQIGIGDLANSDFTGRGTWTLVSQPAGANAIVGATTYIYISIRAMVSGMTLPGDYVFQVNVTNPGFPDLTAQITCTVHPASSPPVITSITSNPAIIALPSQSCLLTAMTSDAEGDLLRHWWVVTSAPAGSNPVFEHQGLRVSNVSGLTVPGNYVFTVRCFDDIHMTTQNVTVTVTGSLDIQPFVLNQEVGISPNPFSSETTIILRDTVSQGSIRIFDILGKEMSLVKFSDKTVTISRDGLAPGIYFLRIADSNKLISVKKVVVE